MYKLPSLSLSLPRAGAPQVSVSPQRQAAC